ncbi:MAG: hypothetical protein EXR76_08370 [Myxococcales bacterium]|nr:hypothetical protein [Myxococcales bacterium]
MAASASNSHVDLEPPEQASRSRKGRVAVLLNANAKRVTEAVRREIILAVPDADVFFTHSLDEAAFVTRRMADLGYDVIYTGGGDGTVVNTLDQVVRRLDELGVTEYPRFGVLRLGTGNGIADFFGAGDYRRDLRRSEAALVKPLHLMEIDGERRAPFFGFGWDAFVLANYDQMKQTAQRFAFTRALFKNVIGYLIAGVGKSVPQLIFERPNWNIRVVNTGGIGLKLDLDGNVIERYAPGAVVYEGPSKVGCFGTTPFYGFKFRMMPFADRTPGMFHFRTLDLHPINAVSQLHKAWNGRIDGPGVHDFMLSGAHVDFETPAPFQIGGDSAGTRTALDVRIVDRAIPCLHFD